MEPHSDYYIARTGEGVADMIVEEGDAEDVPVSESVLRQQVELAHMYDAYHSLTLSQDFNSFLTAY